MMKTIQTKFYYPILLISIVLLIVLTMAAFMFGADQYQFKDVYQALFDYQNTQVQNVLRDIRMPRVIAALLVGMALSCSGAVMQGVTKNPLADPALIGINAGAMFAISVLFGVMPDTSFISVLLVGFLGALVGGTIVLMLGMSQRGGFNTIRIILAGAAVSALLTALSQGVSLFFKTNQVSNLWTSGGVKGVTWSQIMMSAPLIIVVLIVLMFLSHRLTVMSLGEELAQGLGVNTSNMRLLFSLLTMLLAGTAVAIAGNLAFVGLIVPHIARYLAGTDYKRVLPLTLVLGGLFIVMSDMIARLMNDITINAVVSVIGVPFFIYLVRKDGKIHE
ncbi:iron ABC transporter permease [Macrococcus sp. DPC7161]|uniref:FecCD family ABC transporter permease n=1 Tax=Macrococcus sp. DPC7161 TaxID=2507060 RepID=UPI00100B13CE|nr:iron ABC transporter permease [Macrococcus sp. DPC7161]RXK18627.1 iron ABC transporter permease [Macrococcus sp. DPC7161]